MKLKTLPIPIFAVFIIIYSCSEPKSEKPTTQSKNETKEIEVSPDIEKNYYRTEGLREQFIGKSFSDFRENYNTGTNETLEGSSGIFWLVYFTDINITFKLNKATNKIVNICTGRNAGLIGDKSIELKESIGKTYTNEEYTTKIVSSIQYGTTENLGEKNCLNKDCIEYHPNGNFTTMSFYEFNDKGDFVKFKRVGFGRLTELSKYEKKDLKSFYLKKIEVLTKSEYSDKVENNIEFKELRDGSVLIGKWYVKITGLPKYNYQYEIYKKNNKYYGVMISEAPVIKSLTKKGDKYFKDNNSSGEYYTIEGSLRFYDSVGLLDDYNGTSIK